MVADLFGKPFQLKFVRPADMLLFANAICDPPLGQTTVVPYGQQAVRFTVLIESSRSFPEQPWEAVLWHNGHDNREWRELPMLETNATDRVPLAIRSKSRAKVYRRYFSIDLPKPAKTDHPLHFTLKFRVTASENWKWANDQACTGDGELCFQPKKPPGELRDYLRDYSHDITVHDVESQSPDAQLWSILAPIQPALGTDSVFTNTCLGTPRSYTRWFATVRPWAPWLAPQHGKAPFAAPQPAVTCSFLRWDGLHLVLLAISGVDHVLTVFQPDGQGNVIASSRNDSEEPSRQARIIVAAASTYESANAAVMYHARNIVRGDEYMSTQLKNEMSVMIENDVKAEWMENWYDGLTYCTWNALGQDLTEEKIFNALDILKENNINITNLIIDDNWQSLDNQDGVNQFALGWTDFEANKKGFPSGLKHTCLTIRERNPNVQHIAVWHAILGYWGAVSPHGKIARDYKTIKVRKDCGESMTIVDEPDVDRMYDDFYKFLLSCGVDSVKTDAQFMLDEIAHAPDRRRFIRAYQDAWTIASLRYFSIKTISCMSQYPQNIFHSQLPLNKPRVMVRNSDDFFPDIPSSHPFHIFCNAHNSLFTSHLNILPDWDMFQTSHDYSGFHAAGRCISGGPVYITDEPGKHNLDLLAQMTARTAQNKTCVLRPSVFGKTVNMYTAYEEERLLKVGTFVGATGGTGILGLFNISHRVLAELVNINAFPGVEKDGEYIIRSHTTGEISDKLKLSDETPVISLEVEVKGYEILSAYPLRSFTLRGSTGLQSSTTKVAVLGLLGKMTGAAAVTSTDMRIKEDGRLHLEVGIKAMGVLGIYFSTLADRSVSEDVLIMMSGKIIPQHTVKINEEAPILEVDIEKAWDEMELEPGMSNDISLKIFIR